MSWDKTVVWTCDYCEKQVEMKQSNDLPFDWIRNKMLWNQYYSLTVDLCPECFKQIFQKPNVEVHPRAGELKKPFWRRIFKELYSGVESK